MYVIITSITTETDYKIEKLNTQYLFIYIKKDITFQIEI